MGPVQKLVELVEAAVDRVLLVQHPQMPFAYHARGVANRLQRLARVVSVRGNPASRQLPGLCSYPNRC